MKIYVEAVYSENGKINELIVLDNPETIRKCDPQTEEFAWVQVMNGKPVQGFSKYELFELNLV